ncbi:MAG: tetratricopeptide-like helical domain, partial [Akkermansiaceae bacterium]|nr:tetratricopeptide-like helical domain [Akkermansiaceae bacterium]
MIAFTQVMVAGVGLAGRIHQAQQVQVVEKVVTKVVTVSAPAPANTQVVVHAVPPGAALPPPLPPEAPLPPARAISTPPIADPQVERLVMEARKARIAGDMGAAILKLEEARDRAPHEPNTLFEIGQVFEDMAVADPRDSYRAESAADAYQEVYKLGVTGAGSLYEMAARKLRDGIELPDAMRGQLSLGPPRIFRDNDYQEGERVVITVPIRSAPGAVISTKDIELLVYPFDSTTKDGIQPAATDLSEKSYEFVTLPFDFATGEELVQVTYIIKNQSEQQIHLYGKR